MTPKPIAAILDSGAFLLLARVVLVCTFVIPGVMQIAQFNGAVGEFAHFNLNPAPAYVAASFITLLAGSALVILGGRWTWLGAGALGIYTGLTILIVHHFWTMSGQDQVGEMRTAWEHISLIGGLMTVAILEHRREAATSAAGASASASAAAAAKA
jgi:transmembrane protein